MISAIIDFVAKHGDIAELPHIKMFYLPCMWKHPQLASTDILVIALFWLICVVSLDSPARLGHANCEGRSGGEVLNFHSQLIEVRRAVVRRQVHAFRACLTAAGLRQVRSMTCDIHLPAFSFRRVPM